MMRIGALFRLLYTAFGLRVVRAEAENAESRRAPRRKLYVCIKDRPGQPSFSLLWLVNWYDTCQ